MGVIFHKEFQKQYKKLPRKVQKQFDVRFELFMKDKIHPILNNHSVDRRFTGSRSINITGDYRAIFTENGDTTIFLLIGTHSELY